MACQDCGRCGTEPGPLHLAYSQAVVNSTHPPSGTSMSGRKKPNVSPPASVLLRSGTETCSPSAVTFVPTPAALNSSEHMHRKVMLSSLLVI